MTANHLLADAMEPGTIAPRRKRQPTADVMREQLAMAAEEIIRLRAELEACRRPWWRRLLRRWA